MVSGMAVFGVLVLIPMFVFFFVFMVMQPQLFWLIQIYFTFIILKAKYAAFSPLSIPTQATGTPLGI